MTNMRRNKRYAALAAGLGLVVLSGCSQWNQLMGREESVDYRSTVPSSGNPLSIPPDLTQAGDEAHYRAPEGTTTFSQYSQNAQQQQAAGASSNVLPTSDQVRVMR